MSRVGKMPIDVPKGSAAASPAYRADSPPLDGEGLGVG